jgi:ligand-binding sensor domain-containing protein/signal transduction histidine kinase
VSPFRIFRIRWSLLLAFGLGLSFAQAQSFKFRHITTDDGLLSGNVLTVVQDYQGFFWFGSEEGLQRYDGYTFKNYFFQNADSTSLSSNFIQFVFEDSKRNLWVGTFDSGLCWYDRENDRFIRFQHNPNDSTSILGNFVQTIYESKDGVLYVSIVGNGLSSFRIPEKIDGTLRFTNRKFNKTMGGANHWISAMVETDQYGFLVAINGDGVNHFDPSTGIFTPMLRDSVGLRVQALYVDSKQRLWIGTWSDGLYVIEKDRKKIIHHEAGDDAGQLLHNQVFSIKEDADGNFWVGTDNGLNIIKSETDPFDTAPFVRLTHDDFDNESLLSNSIKYLFADKRKRIWVATYFGGINVYDRNALMFSSAKAKAGKPSSLTHNNVYALEEDAGGNIWVGTDGGGLNFIKKPMQGTDFLFRKIFLQSYGAPAEKIKCLKADDEGNLWVGTWGSGLFRIDTENHSAAHVEISAMRGSKMPVKEILAIDTDSSGNLWIGTFGFGVLHYNVKDRSFRQYLQAAGNGSQEINKVNDILVDKYSRVWVARDGGGLSIIDPAAGLYSVVEKGALTGSLTVASIMEDSNGSLWVCTNSVGLIKYNHDTGETEVFDVSRGLPTHSVVSALEDSDHSKIWIGTNRGISSLDTKTEVIINFSASDGLPGNHFNNSALRDSQTGMMLFGSIDGLAIFQPENIDVKIYNPQIVFTEFRINNKDVPIGTNSALKRNITLTDHIELPHFENSFSIEFAALMFQQVQTTRYGYLLENFGDEWIDLGTERRIAFTGLPPGNYLLRVRATNNKGEFMKQTPFLSIHIQPAWWQTNLFKILLSLAMISSVYMLVRVRTGYLKKQRVVLRNQVEKATAEIQNKNSELEARVALISEQNGLLQKQSMEIAARDNEILAQNEELASQNELILDQKQDLEEAHVRLKSMNDQLEELVRLRTSKLQETITELDTVLAELDRFVYSASHDLSAPLKSVLGLINISRKENDKNQLETYHNYMERSIKKLERVIDSLVEFSRNTHRPVVSVEFDFDALLKEVFEELAFWPEACQVKMHNHVMPELVVESDPDRLKVILHNLIGNAIKYADFNKKESSVWVSVAIADSSFSIIVKDNGIGIESSNLNRIFDMYYRGSDRSKGSGLGLFIVKETAKKLGGVVRVKSVFGTGSEFEVLIPLRHEVKGKKSVAVLG